MKTSKRRKMEFEVKGSKAITLIALVITVVVLLILARSKHCNINRREWLTNQNE